MDNFNNNNIYPDDQWQSLSTPIVKTEAADAADEEPEVTVKPKKHSKHPVLTLQLTISLCALLFLFILKFLGTELYNSVINWYEKEISKSVIYNGDFESLDFSSLFSTADEV